MSAQPISSEIDTNSLLARVHAASELVIYGAGKMGQQLTALLRNLPTPRAPKYFVTTTGSEGLVEGLPVLSAASVELPNDALILVATARGHHSDISRRLQNVAPRNSAVFVTAVQMDDLKRIALTTMLGRMGIDVTLLKSLTNDILSSVTRFDAESYSGSIKQRMYQIALDESAHFVMQAMLDSKAFDDCWAYRRWVVERASLPGLFLEFGVADGTTLDFFARCRPDRSFVGFDSFIGLPEFWKDGFAKGKFAQPALPIVASNATLIKGWFAETARPFLETFETTPTASFIHIDCDLYSSTKDVLEACAPALRSGTIIAFDEYMNYPGWQAHEHRALTEFASAFGFGFRYLAFVENGNQVAIEITSTPT